MKYVMCFLCLLIWIVDDKQDSVKQNGIYLTEVDYSSPILTESFNNSEGKLIVGKHSVIIRTASGNTHKYYNDSIWGIRQNGENWRILNEDAYKLTFVGKIVIYKIPAMAVLESDAPQTYFSRDIHSPLHQLTRKALCEVYHDDTSFVKKVQSLPITSSLFRWNKEKTHYLFIDWIGN